MDVDDIRLETRLLGDDDMASYGQLDIVYDSDDLDAALASRSRTGISAARMRRQ